MRKEVMAARRATLVGLKHKVGRQSGKTVWCGCEQRRDWQAGSDGDGVVDEWVRGVSKWLAHGPSERRRPTHGTRPVREGVADKWAQAESKIWNWISKLHRV